MNAGPPKISVLICTHNPDIARLRCVLEALQNQTLPKDQWELLLVDNRSEPPLDEGSFLKYLKNGRLIPERTPGKPYALVTGFKLAKAEIILTLDDDNVPSESYLKTLLELAAKYPRVGVFSASIEGVLEKEMPEWFSVFSPFLAIRELDKDIIGRFNTPHAAPIGAGMAVRRPIVESYLQTVKACPPLLELGRSGSSLQSAADDSLIGFLAEQAGYECGGFHGLRLKHLIPERRLHLEYLGRLVQAVTASQELCHYIFGAKPPGFLKRMKWEAGRFIFSVHPAKIHATYRKAVICGKISAARLFLHRQGDFRI